MKTNVERAIKGLIAIGVAYGSLPESFAGTFKTMMPETDRGQPPAEESHQEEDFGPFTKKPNADKPRRN